MREFTYIDRPSVSGTVSTLYLRLSNVSAIRPTKSSTGEWRCYVLMNCGIEYLLCHSAHAVNSVIADYEIRIRDEIRNAKGKP